MRERIGHYRLVRVLGHGGMGEVYLAEDTKLNRLAAIKTLRPHLVADETALRRFRQEALAASGLNHPNIVVVYEIGEVDGLHYMVTEYVEGDTLRTRIAAGALTTGAALDLAVQIADALAVAHAAGIVHRDLKPQNVIVRPDGYIKILDFGLAKLSRADRAPHETVTLMTVPGAVVGTVHYMSPEQAQGHDVDHRTDIFSFGTMLYEMVSGRRPFTATAFAPLLIEIIQSDPARPSTFAPGVPPALEDVIYAALRKKKEERYQSATSLAGDLRQLRDDLAFQARLESAALGDGPSREHRGAAVSSAKLPRWGESTVTIAATLRAAAPAPSRGPSRRTLLYSGSAAAALAAGAAYRFWPASGRMQTPDSIAIMPFANASGDPANAYLSDGLSESLTTNLARLRSVRVLARSTVASYAGKNLDPRTAGKELKVAAMLNGRVSQRGAMVTVAVELADTRSGDLIWSESYQRRASDLYPMEKEIAHEIIDRLKLELTQAAKDILASGADPAGVYQLYLKGRSQLAKVSLDGRRQALEFFQRAIDQDPRYAPAYAGLAETYATLAYATPPREMLGKAREAAQKSASLDQTLPRPHSILARVLEYLDWNWPESEREYRRAMDLNPTDGAAHSDLGQFLMRGRRTAEALAATNVSLEIEPVSLMNICNRSWIYYHNRQYDQAIRDLQRALAIAPDSAWALHILGGVYTQKGMHREAVEVHKKAAANSDDPTFLTCLATAHAAAGNAGEARRLLGRLLASAKSRYVPPFWFAWIYSSLGDAGPTFDYLHKSLEERDPAIRFVRIEPMFERWHSDARYAEILQRLNLPA